MAEVRWSLTAEADLRAIEGFIAQDSVLHAVDLVDRLVEGVEHLSHAPRMGRVVPEFQREDLRELLFRAYRVVLSGAWGDGDCAQSRACSTRPGALGAPRTMGDRGAVA